MAASREVKNVIRRGSYDLFNFITTRAKVNTSKVLRSTPLPYQRAIAFLRELPAPRFMAGYFIFEAGENMTSELTKISQQQQLLSKVKTIDEAQKILHIARGYVVAATKEYKAASISEAKEDKEISCEIGNAATQLQFMTEARLGELIQEEQQAGRLAKQSGNRNLPNNVVRLKDYGLTWQDSSRAQRLAEHKELIPDVIIKAIKANRIATRKSLDSIIREKTTPNPPSPASQNSEISDPNIILGDYSILYDKLDNNSIDLFFTDPPYSENHLDLYGGLAGLAGSPA